MSDALPVVDASRVGALVVGGQHPGLGVATSLGRRGIPVFVVDDRPSIAALSKFVTRSIHVDDLRDEQNTVNAVLEIGRRFRLQGWVLFPTRDETVAAFSRFRRELEEIFRVTTAPWESVQWAWDKKRTYELASRLNIPVPATFNPRSVEDLTALASRLPLAIKPAIKERFFYATGAKAWRANMVHELVSHYKKACRWLKPEEILVQEVIPGDGRTQFSYCALCRDGKPVNVLVARRSRQHPREFGRAATYVETIEEPAIEALSERFLAEINYCGLVEIEFKLDQRDGKYKLLDVNARTWGFHTLGSASGVDFAYLQFADALGQASGASRAASGIGWLRLITDLPTAFSQMVRGELSVASYVRSLAQTRIESAFSFADPLPGLLEYVILPWSAVRMYLGGRRRPNGELRAMYTGGEPEALG